MLSPLTPTLANYSAVTNNEIGILTTVGSAAQLTASAMALNGSLIPNKPCALQFHNKLTKTLNEVAFPNYSCMTPKVGPTVFPQGRFEVIYHFAITTKTHRPELA